MGVFQSIPTWILGIREAYRKEGSTACVNMSTTVPGGREVNCGWVRFMEEVGMATVTSFGYVEGELDL